MFLGDPQKVPTDLIFLFVFLEWPVELTTIGSRTVISTPNGWHTCYCPPPNEWKKSFLPSCVCHGLVFASLYIHRFYNSHRILPSLTTFFQISLYRHSSHLSRLSTPFDIYGRNGAAWRRELKTGPGISARQKVDPNFSQPRRRWFPLWFRRIRNRVEQEPLRAYFRSFCVSFSAHDRYIQLLMFDWWELPIYGRGG